MSDEATTTSTATPAAPATGQPEAATEPTSSTPAESAPESQTPAPAAKSADSRGGVNLQADPNFKKFQAQANRRFEQERKAREAAERRADELAASNLSESEQLRYRAEAAERRLEEEKQARERETEIQRLAQLREDHLSGLSERAGVPLEVLEAATDPAHAERLALDYVLSDKQAQAEEQAKAVEHKKAANTSDTGSSASGHKPESVQQYERAVEARDPVAIARAAYMKQE